MKNNPRTSARRLAPGKLPVVEALEGRVLLDGEAPMLHVWLSADAVSGGDYNVQVWAQLLDAYDWQGLSDATVTINTPDSEGLTVPKVDARTGCVLTQWNPDILAQFAVADPQAVDSDADGDVDAVSMSIHNLHPDWELVALSPVLLATQVWTFLADQAVGLDVTLAESCRYYDLYLEQSLLFGGGQGYGQIVRPYRPAGDLSGDNLVTADDLKVIVNHFGSVGGPCDLNSDGLVDEKDVDYFLSNLALVPRGDANFDHVVDYLDFQVLLDYWNPCDGGSDWSHGDFNHDGYTDFIDFQRLLDNWQQEVVVTGNCGALGNGRGATAYDIDKDGDGFGVGPNMLGPDADDLDPAVMTSSSALAKYGSVQAVLEHKGYHPQRLLYVSPFGDDQDGTIGDINHPFASWQGVEYLLQPGDAVVYRAGTYYCGYETNDAAIWITAYSPSGTTEAPILVTAMPGERVLLYALNPTGRTYGISVDDAQYYILDGFDIVGQSFLGAGAKVVERADYITLRNLHVYQNYWGILLNSTWNDVLIEGCVIHDTYTWQGGEHGIYVGAESGVYSQNVTIRDNVIYSTGTSVAGQGIHINGMIRNATVEGNIIHSCGTVGIDLMNGVTDSIIRNNLVFGNYNAQCILVSNYSGGATDPLATMDNIQIVNNTLVSNSDVSSRRTCIRISVDYPGRADNLVIRNNILYYDVGNVRSSSCIQFDNSLWWYTAHIENNLAFNVNADCFMLLTNTGYTLEQAEQLSPYIHANLWTEPEFLCYCGDLFDWRFDLLPGSSGIVLGTTVGAPIYDLRYMFRSPTITAGALQG